MIKVAFVLLTFDGVKSFYCGVGAVTQYLIASFEEIQEGFRSENINFDYHILYSSIPKEFGNNDKIIERTKQLISKNSNVFLESLSHDILVKNPFGTFKSWPILCEKASKYIKNIKNAYDKIVVIAQDTPFAAVSNFLPLEDKSLKVIWIAQSTGKIWNRGIDIIEKERYQWERIAIDMSSNFENVFLGSISNYMREHLTKEWQAPNNKIIPFINGISIPYLNTFESVNQQTIRSLLTRYKIPTNIPLFLSFGRAQWYKGLDLAAKIGVLISKYHKIHVVICALNDYTGEADKVINELKTILNQNPHSSTLLTDFPTFLPRSLMQWHLCNALAMTSKREPFGLIPSEFRIMGSEDAILISSNAGGLKEQMKDRNDGIVVDINSKFKESDIEPILNIWQNASELKLNLNGRKNVSKNYCIGKNYINGIKQII